MKHSLDNEVEYDFVLIGISCHEKDYRLCWGINSVVDFNLERSDKELHTLPTKKKSEISYHSLFSYFESENESECHLIVNRSSTGFLIPEKPQADYLFLIKDEGAIDIIELNLRIKSIPFVLTTFIIDVDTLKSKDNLIF
jgi:hypothetical protein